jgi:hypothetical protein
MTSVMNTEVVSGRRQLLLPDRRNEPLETLIYLRSIPYSEYGQTRWWRFRRESYADGRHKCLCCGVFRQHGPLELPKFHVHHLTYAELGQEPDEHLAYVCSPCHNLIHYPESHAAQHWLQHKGPTLLASAEAMRP